MSRSTGSVCAVTDRDTVIAVADVYKRQAAEHSFPWEGMASTITASESPKPSPPYAGSSVLNTGTYRLWGGTPIRYFDWAGFEWLVPDDNHNNVVVFLRRDKKGRDLMCAVNFSPNTYTNYRMGVPPYRRYVPVFNTDDLALIHIFSLRPLHSSGLPGHGGHGPGQFHRRGAGRQLLRSGPDHRGGSGSAGSCGHSGRYPADRRGLLRGGEMCIRDRSGLAGAKEAGDNINFGHGIKSFV